MNRSLPARAGSRQGNESDSSGRRAAFSVLAVVLVVLAGCATLQPGADKPLVRAQQTLSGALPIYDGAMSWYFKNAATLSPGTRAIFERVRVQLPVAYTALDTTVDAYKAGKGGDLVGLEAKLSDLIVQVVTAVQAAGGPNLASGGK